VVAVSMTEHNLIYSGKVDIHEVCIADGRYALACIKEHFAAFRLYEDAQAPFTEKV
jgi:hypothetical protein